MEGQTRGKVLQGNEATCGIGAGLLPDPEILILDEPTSGLDPRGMIEVREILNGLKDGRRPLLISTHMLNEVSEVCDQVTVIRRGEKVMGGSVRELQRQAVGEAILEVSVRRPFQQDFLQEIGQHDGVESVDAVDEYTFTIDLSDNNAEREWIVETIGKHGLGFMTMGQKGSDLEDLYMSLTQEGDDDVK